MNAIEAHTPSLAPKFAHLVLNALPHPVLMIESDDRIADADVAAEDFFEVSLPVLRRHLLRDLVPFGSPLLALIDNVRDRAAPVSKYRVDLGTPRNPGESIVDLHVAPVLERPGHVVIMLLERTIAYKMDCQLTHRGAARSVIALAAMLAHEIKKLAQNGFARHIRLVQDYDPSLPPVLANRSAEAIGEGAALGEIQLTTALRPGVRLSMPGASLCRLSSASRTMGPGCPKTDATFVRPVRHD
jgi:nitrogen-specific signal transduction histidine kinase